MLEIQLFRNPSLQKLNESFGQINQEFLEKQGGGLIISIICVISLKLHPKFGITDEEKNSIIAVVKDNSQNIQQIRLPLGRNLPTEKPNDFVDFTINNDRRISIPTDGNIKIGKNSFDADDTTGQEAVVDSFTQNFMNQFGSSVNSITSLIGVNELLALTRTSSMYKAENSKRSMTADFNKDNLITNYTKMVLSNNKYPQNNFSFYLQNSEVDQAISDIQQEENRIGSRILELG